MDMNYKNLLILIGLFLRLAAFASVAFVRGAARPDDADSRKGNDE
jgi:hypothetical protein